MKQTTLTGVFRVKKKNNSPPIFAPKPNFDDTLIVNEEKLKVDTFASRRLNRLKGNFN